jgi:hypothetical protein
MRPLPPPVPGVRLAPPPPPGGRAQPEPSTDDDGVDVDDAELFEDSKHE